MCCFHRRRAAAPGGGGFVDWRLCGALSRALLEGFFAGAPDEKLLMPDHVGHRCRSTDLRRRARQAARRVTTLGLEHAITASLAMLEKVKAEHIALAVPLLPQLDGIAVGAVVKPRASCRSGLAGTGGGAR